MTAPSSLVQPEKDLAARAVPHISQSPFWMPIGVPVQCRTPPVSATTARVDRWELLQHTRPYVAQCRGAAIARCNPILDQGAIVAVHPVLEKAAGELASRRSIDRRSTGLGRDQAYPKPSSIGPAIACQGGRWVYRGVANASPNRKAGHNHPRAAGSDRQRQERPSRTQDARCAQNAGHHAAELKEGEVTWIEALETLIEQLTLRDSRRVSTALRMSRLTTVKKARWLDFAFQLHRNRILARAQSKFICLRHRQERSHDGTRGRGRAGGKERRVRHDRGHRDHHRTRAPAVPRARLPLCRRRERLPPGRAWRRQPVLPVGRRPL